MCVANLNLANVASFEYDYELTNASSICANNCFGSGTCSASTCNCQSDVIGAYCSQDVTKLTVLDVAETLTIPANKYIFLKVSRINYTKNSNLVMKLSNTVLRIYVTTDNNSNLPSSINSFKDFQINSSSGSSTGSIALNGDLKVISAIENNNAWDYLNFGKISPPLVQFLTFLRNAQ